MKPNELAEQLSRETTAYVCLAVDREGNAFGAGSNVPLVISIMAGQHKADATPSDVLTSIRVLESLTKGQRESKPGTGRGRKPGKAAKPAPTPAEKQPKPEAAQAA